MSADTLSHHHIPTEYLIVELDEARAALVNAGQPPAAIRRLDDTIATPPPGDRYPGGNIISLYLAALDGGYATSHWTTYQR